MFMFPSRMLSALLASPLMAALLSSATRAASETVIYSFQGYAAGDGELPLSGVIDVGGALFGTTADGGTNNHGTIFSLTPTGAETVLYSFKGGKDGFNPYGGLVNVGDNLYGTTEGGGKSATSGCCGTVYSLTLPGIKTTIHMFQQKAPNDGAYPAVGLIYANGLLYGTTPSGGANRQGTVFDVSESGVESVVYSFLDVGDGRRPTTVPTYTDATLFGTTMIGGANIKQTV